MAKRTIKINLKLPAGVVATADLVQKATKAAKDVVDASISDLVDAQKLAKELATKGIYMTAQEILDRKKGTKSKSKKTAKKAAGKTAPRKRVVLTPAKRKTLIADLKAGAKIAAVAEKYGVSTATVMNIKTSAGLTKTRKK